MAAAVAKAKLRTSEDVYKRLKIDLQWDEAWAGEEDLWIGYEDGVFGPMEMRFAAFTPISEGGDLPFTRFWYFRRGDSVIWDRRRRFDALWESGETPGILAHQQGRRVKGFDAEKDKHAEMLTLASIQQARETLARMEEERQVAAAEKQKRKLRQQRRQLHPGFGNNCLMGLQGEGPLFEQAAVLAIGDGAAAGKPKRSLTIATWNVLNDAFAASPETLSQVRAPSLAASLVEVAPDIICLQEVTPAVLAALDATWPERLWRTDEPGELTVLSRLPIVRAICVSLGEGTSKKALIVEVVVQDRALAVANVHFTSDRRGDHLVDNSHKRASQAKVLRAALAKHMSHADAFVCGDFNEPNVDGLESAVSCMEGLVDVWAAVHDSANPGHTYDPERNDLAARDAVNRVPRRIDRIFAAQRWRPESASLLGEGLRASDHFGVVAALGLERVESVKPVHTSALVLLPPDTLWKRIDEIRKRFDPSFGRWMPHVNVLYSFVPEAYFDEAVIIIERIVRKHGPIQISFDEFAVFEHGRSASLVLLPTCSPVDTLATLQHDLQQAFPQCSEQSLREGRYRPHLTVGKFDSAEEARCAKVELERTWQAPAFPVDELALIARTGDRPFRVAERVPLGCSAALRAGDAALLEALEAASGARVYLLGSGLLLGGERPLGSDLDVLLVGPRGQEAVFEALSASMPAAWVRRAQGRFPVLAMEVDGVHLDVQYAQSRCHRHPLYWPGPACGEGGLAAGALRDALAVRSAILRAHGLGGWQRYQRALLRVKKWAKARGIYSNALGYLGGWSWSLLLVATALAAAHEESDTDGRSLVALMFKRYAAWPWPKPVELGLSSVEAGSDAMTGPRENGAGDGLMPVLCPSAPWSDSARNVTAATRAVIQAELQAAAAGGPRPGSVLGGVEVVVRCQVLLPEGPERPVCAAWVEARLIQLVRGLGASQPRPLKVKEGLWAIGLADPRSARRIEQAFQDFRGVLARDLPPSSQAWADEVDIQVEDPKDFKRAMASSLPGLEEAGTSSRLERGP